MYEEHLEGAGMVLRDGRVLPRGPVQVQDEAVEAVLVSANSSRASYRSGRSSVRSRDSMRDAIAEMQRTVAETAAAAAAAAAAEAVERFVTSNYRSEGSVSSRSSVKTRSPMGTQQLGKMDRVVRADVHPEPVWRSLSPPCGRKACGERGDVSPKERDAVQYHSANMPGTTDVPHNIPGTNNRYAPHNPPEGGQGVPPYVPICHGGAHGGCHCQYQSAPISTFDLKTLLSRQSDTKTLPHFEGDAMEWPSFKNQYLSSTERCGFTDDENLGRLRNCLKGRAKKAVQALLAIPGSANRIINTLEMCFGRPEIIITELGQQLERLKPVKEDDFSGFLDFVTEVQNYVATIDSLGYPEYLINPTLTQNLLTKLPAIWRIQWGEHVADKQQGPTRLCEFSSWLCKKGKAVCHLSNQPSSAWQNHENTPKGKFTSSVVEKCACCQQGFHPLTECSKWIKMEVNSRWDWARNHSICFRCLKRKHGAKKICDKICGLCEGNHHDTLHKAHYRTNPTQSAQLHFQTLREPLPTNCTAPAEDVNPCELSHEAASSPPSSGGPSNLCMRSQGEVLLKVIPVRVSGPAGSLETFALLDEGSTLTMMQDELAQKLGISGPNKPLTVQWTGEIVRTEDRSKIVSFHISGTFEGARTLKVNGARTVENLCLSPQSVNVVELSKRWPHMNRATASSFTDARPTLLIGQDNWPLLMPRKSFFGPWRGPVLTKTWLGWVVHGNTPKRCLLNSSFNSDHFQYSHWEDFSEQQDEEVHELIKRHLGESIFSEEPNGTLSNLDRKARDIFESTSRRCDDGQRWETGLLWKEGTPLPESRRMAQRRLFSLERKLDTDPELAAKYCMKMEEYVTKGYARKLTEEELRAHHEKIWYLPHLGVTNPNKPGKLRVVFDASAKSHGVSINDCLLKGPDMYSSLLGLLWRFRQYPIALSADIKEMYPQIRIIEGDQHAQRYLWRGMRRDVPPDVFIMKSMVFGMICSPYSAQEIRNRNAIEFQNKLPKATEAVLRNHYMDNYLDSVKCEDDARKMVNEVSHIHQQGGFLLCQWACNARSIIDSIPPNLRAEPKGDEKIVERILGMSWCQAEDLFAFEGLWKKITNGFTSKRNHLTRREVLSLTMTVYDPLGYLSYFTLQAKLLLQETWKKCQEWDEPLPDDLNKKWCKWMDDFEITKHFQLTRCYTQKLLEATRIELHTFTDASEKAYSAVAYLRILTVAGDLITSFIAAKSRVAPIKPKTIPRLELMGAVLGCHLAKDIRSEHTIKFDESYFWSDSMAVLGWIQGKHTKLNTFVANRVNIIKDLSKPSQWRWVPSSENAADIATRPENKFSIEHWNNGPAFLLQLESEWKLSPKCHENEGIEVRFVNSHVEEITQDTQLLELPNLERFSNYNRALRATAYLVRYMYNCQRKKGERLDCPLRVDELQKAETLLMRKMQNDSFGPEIKLILSEQPLKRGSRLFNLNPFLDSGGILRVRGRINEAQNVDTCVKNPIILDPDHRFTKLLIRRKHIQGGHIGAETVLSELRQRFWVLRARKAVKRSVQACYDCWKSKAKPSTPPMGNLPIARLEHHKRPFTATGIDYFGPFHVTVGRHREKRYGVLFTCLTTRAVHLEIAYSLDTNSAIMAIRRFCARRGCPAELYSDNATNFKGANAELKEELGKLNAERIQDNLAVRGIQWNFIPPASPHMGGAWERLVRSVKIALYATLNEKFPKDEVLLTVMVEAEAVVNSRPLTPNTCDPQSGSPLTPNHFLLGTANVDPACGRIPPDEHLSKSWQISQQLTDKFWTRWLKEYLPTLIPRTKSHDQVSDCKVGDLVLIVDSNSVRGEWSKGVITMVHPGNDGRVRVADVKTSTGLYRRPVVKLCRWEPEQQE